MIFNVRVDKIIACLLIIVIGTKGLAAMNPTVTFLPQQTTAEEDSSTPLSGYRIYIENNQKQYLANIDKDDDIYVLSKIPFTLKINSDKEPSTTPLSEGTIRLPSNQFIESLDKKIFSNNYHWCCLYNQNDIILVPFNPLLKPISTNLAECYTTKFKKDEIIIQATFSENSQYLLIITKELIKEELNITLIDPQKRKKIYTDSYTFPQKLKNTTLSPDGTIIAILFSDIKYEKLLIIKTKDDTAIFISLE